MTDSDKPRKTDAFKRFWEGLQPGQKKKFLLWGFIAGAVALAILGSMIKGDKSITAVPAQSQVRTLKVDKEAMSNSVFQSADQVVDQLEAENQRRYQELKKELEAWKKGAEEREANMKKELEELKAQPPGVIPADATAPTNPVTPTNKAQIRFRKGPGPGAENRPLYPPMPGANPGGVDGSNSLPRVNRVAGGAQASQAHLIPLEDQIVHFRPKEVQTKNEKSSLTKPGEGFYLPISIIPATMLTGLEAAVVEEGKNNPEPVVLRISAPAILPNNIRRNLTGCLVTAEGYGSLAKERVLLRTKKISCLGRKGQAVIEESINGVITDADGKVGAYGTPRAKFGASLARAAGAGFFEGFGEMVARSSETTNTTVTGESTSIDSSQIGKAAIGKGISSGSGEIAKFWMKLAQMR